MYCYKKTVKTSFIYFCYWRGRKNTVHAQEKLTKRAPVCVFFYEFFFDGASPALTLAHSYKNILKSQFPLLLSARVCLWLVHFKLFLLEDLRGRPRREVQ